MSIQALESELEKIKAEGYLKGRLQHAQRVYQDLLDYGFSSEEAERITGLKEAESTLRKGNEIHNERYEKGEKTV